jgi:hypothetical protein
LCVWARGQCHEIFCVNNTGGKFAAIVNYTCGKFATGVNAAGSKFGAGANNTGGKKWEQYQNADTLK